MPRDQFIIFNVTIQESSPCRPHYCDFHFPLKDQDLVLAASALRASASLPSSSAAWVHGREEKSAPASVRTAASTSLATACPAAQRRGGEDERDRNKVSFTCQPLVAFLSHHPQIHFIEGVKEGPYLKAVGRVQDRRDHLEEGSRVLAVRVDRRKRLLGCER